VVKLLGFVLPLGLAVGARVGERWRERAEHTAGIALILLGIYRITNQLVR
jgi:putative Mn2+ efflux pump MntP